MQITPVDIKGYQLLHEGALALSQIQLNGMKIDLDHCHLQDRRLTKKIKKAEIKLSEYKEVQKWKELYGSKFKYNSNEQLSELLYDHLKLKAKKQTGGDQGSTDEESLQALNMEWLNLLLERRKMEKIQGTYLGGILREQVDGFLYPFFNLHTVVTFRSSSSNINFQNIPVRIPWVKSMVRKAFLPRTDKRVFGEKDYGGIEVKVAACYHRDPTMIEDITDPERDMHRDMAMECYKLEMDEWTKDARYCGKNKFVFPQFYGDYYVNCAQALWVGIEQLNLKTADGVPLKKHLAKHGIRSYKKFEKHIQKVERKFWEDRYPVYNQWKNDHVESYQENGYFDSFTGFRYQGVMSRNEAINYAVQGSAFHCLLWSLIHIQKISIEEKWETKILGQIHDAIVFDFEPSEINHVMKVTDKIMCHDIREVWPWLIVPLDAETEFSPAGKSWYEKDEVHFHPCNCGNEWMYHNKKKNIWTCPICSNNFIR